jgi:hypothetical protein
LASVSVGGDGGRGRPDGEWCGLGKSRKREEGNDGGENGVEFHGDE